MKGFHLVLIGGLMAAGVVFGLFGGLKGADRGLFPYTDTQAVARGQAVYALNCASCHGADLEGAPDWRSRDAEGYMPAPPHDATGHTWHHPDAQLFLITKHGTEAFVGDGYRSRMPGFGDTLSDDQILEVMAYIKSTWPGELIEAHNRINRDSAAQ